MQRVIKRSYFKGERFWRKPDDIKERPNQGNCCRGSSSKSEVFFRNHDPPSHNNLFTETFPCPDQIKQSIWRLCCHLSVSVSSVSPSADYPLTASTLLLINAPSRCVQHRASAYKHRTLGFVTSPFVATALSISASILFTPLLLNIYPHANSTVSEEVGVFTDLSLFLLCLSSPKKERKVWLCWHVCLSWAKERGDYVGLYVCLTRCLAPGNAMTAAAVTAEIMNWWLSTNTQNGILRFLWLALN